MKTWSQSQSLKRKILKRTKNMEMKAQKLMMKKNVKMNRNKVT